MVILATLSRVIYERDKKGGEIIYSVGGGGLCNFEGEGGNPLGLYFNSKVNQNIFTLDNGV